MIRDPLDPRDILNERFQGITLVRINNYTPNLNFIFRHNDVNDSSCRPAFPSNRGENVVTNIFPGVDALIELALHRSKKFGLRDHSKHGAIKDDWYLGNVMALH